MPRRVLNVNGNRHRLDLDGGTPLLWVLRDELGLTAAKYGCGLGVCGACTVLVDGEARTSCTLTLQEAAGREVVTLEGLSPDGSHPLQQAWLAEQVAQCGFCQPAQILTAAALLRQKPRPTDADVDRAFADVICRCGTYLRIRQAVHRAARKADS